VGLVERENEAVFDAPDMTGKVALVTGGATGTGRATALRLARAGADICLLDIDAEGVENAASEVRALGVKALAVARDISIQENCQAAVGEAVAAFGRLDALCNVAGIYRACHSTAMPVADFQATLAVNLAGPFYLMQASIPHLLKTNGAVVNVTSVAGVVAQAYMAAYCATKAGLNHMTKALAMEYMHQPIRFNAVAPAAMMTKMVTTATFPEDMDQSLFQRGSPLRGMVEVEDVAEVIVFLASDRARNYHGAVISIDKGISAG
jgi:NAD(P)-dependent dehydrogenase (short-subunit alcohol dehydrogenase family)